MKDYNGNYVPNYGWVCPLCGYDGGAVGAPYDISVDGHYIGETQTYQRMMSCAGVWGGGCAQLSYYTIDVTFK